jgi:hypothetical protein
VDYHHYPVNPVAAGLFWTQSLLRLPGNRRLDPYTDRYRRYTDYLDAAARHLTACIDGKAGSVQAYNSLAYLINKAIGHLVPDRVAPSFHQKEKPHVMGYYRGSDRPVVVGLFWPGRNSFLATFRSMGSRSDRYCCDPDHFGSTWRNIANLDER